MSSLKSRVLVSVVGIPLLLGVVLLAPDAVIMAALAALAGIGAHELMNWRARRVLSSDEIPFGITLSSSLL